MARRGGAVSISCTSGDFQRLYARTRNWDATLKRELRKQLHAAVRPTAQAAKANARALRLNALPPSARQERRSTGLRRGIAAGVRIVQRGAANGVEFRIRATHPMSRPTNARSFRHPVYGNRGVWVTQASQPWWDNAMREGRPLMQRAASEALRNAVDEI